MNHSPEPWTFTTGLDEETGTRWFAVRDGDRKLVLYDSVDSDDSTGEKIEDDFKRIVACVNFLKEFPTSWLEAHHAVYTTDAQTLADIEGFDGLMVVVRNQTSVRNPDTSGKRKEKP